MSALECPVFRLKMLSGAHVTLLGDRSERLGSEFFLMQQLTTGRLLGFICGPNFVLKPERRYGTGTRQTKIGKQSAD